MFCLDKFQKPCEGPGRRRILAQFNDEEEHHPVAEPLSHKLLRNEKHTDLFITYVSIKLQNMLKTTQVTISQKVATSKNALRGDGKRM